MPISLVNYLIMALLALSPISEVRGALIYGFSAGMEPYSLLAISTLLNIIIVPVLFWLLGLSKLRELAFKVFGKNAKSKIEKNQQKFEKWGLLALIPFVGVPLPLTGAYTGVLISEALDFDRKKASLAIALGVIMAAAIVFLGLSGVVHFLKL